MRDVIILDMIKHGIKNYVFTTKAVDFTTLKSHTPVGFQGLPALANTMTHMGHVYARASWKLQAGSWDGELGAGNKLLNIC